MTSFNFTEDLGFEEGLASPSDVLTIITQDANNYQVTDDVKFSEHGITFRTGSGGPYGAGINFVPWSFVKVVHQSF